MKNLKYLVILLLFTVSTVSAQAAHSVTLNWTWTAAVGSPAATGFHVYRSTTGTAGSFTVVASPAVGTLTFVDSSVAVQVAGTSFYYQVTAFNAGGESPPSNIVLVVIPNLNVGVSAPVGLGVAVQ